MTATLPARLAWAQTVAGQAGELLMASFRAGVGTEDKGRGIVTELDRRAEALIAGALADAFPGDGLLAEEGTARESSSGFRWVVDPLDGTTNYVAGLPMFTVSLGCLDGEGSALGVIYAPALDEWHLGLRTDAARVAPPGPTGLERAVFIVNKAYQRAPVLWEVAGGLMGAIRAFRTLGCVSLDLAWVAAGRVDGLVLMPASPWDVAAGLLLVERAGLQARSLDGAPDPDGSGGILVTTAGLLEPALGLLRPTALEPGP
ncbi:MAG TPA: inositol monophosphatase [Actinomycetota bacterium]|nr:inositol monophosphatase [Actinomycetota bacterium]